MQSETDPNLIVDKLDALQASVNILAEMVLKLQKDKTTFGEWVNEKEAMKITKLSRSTLLKLRREDKISSSFISGKTPYYKISDFKKLLDNNEQECKKWN